VISHFIEDSIELHNPPEPVVEHESENEDEGHDIFGGLVGKTENFWILQSSAVVEIENARKQQLIDEIVRVVVEALQSEANSSAQDGEVPETPTCPNTYSTDISPTKSEGSNHTGKRKTRRTTPAGESDNEDSGSEENDKSPKSAKYVSQASLGLACPYFKRNPQKYRSHRTCVGPGWGSVHRVK
jgi:hypothetical protein